MNVLFLTLSQVISDISSRGIYPDLLRKFAREGHNVYIVCPFERRFKKATCLSVIGNIHILAVKTLNITKTNIVEKGIGTIIIEYQFRKAIKKYLPAVNIELLLYSTPPITFNSLIRYLKRKYSTRTYLLLKDIFPQNAVDLGMFCRRSIIYRYFRRKERELYSLSDNIGCMSPANVDFILKENPFIPKESVEVCPNSIEIQQISELQGKGDIISKYSISKDALIFIYSGNMGKPQGIDFLLEVLASNRNRKDVYFFIVGGGTEYYKLDKWFRLAKPSNATLIPNVTRKVSDSLIAASEVGLIFLDRRFTIPNYPSRLLSYLEMRIPVLMAIDKTTDIGKIAQENGYGFWVESGNLEAFNKTLNYMIEKREELAIMGERGYQYLLENYTVDKAYKIIISHFI